MRISDWSSDVCSSDLADQEVEVGTCVGLHDGFDVKLYKAPVRSGDGRHPGSAAGVQLLCVDMEVEAASRDVEADAVAVPHPGKGAAGCSFGRAMHDNGAAACARHARVRDAHHVDTAFRKLPTGPREVVDTCHPRP